jgi:hypothetical protein
MTEYDDNGDMVKEQISYDLRQRRAKFIGDCIDELIASMKAENYYAWFECIDDLYDVSDHMFHNEDTEKEYNQLKNDVISLANKYQATWTGRTKEATAVSEIKKSLRILTRFLLKKIEESGAFGTRSYDEDEL